MRWLLLTFVTVVFLLVITTVLLLFPVVQTWIGRILGDKLSADLGITVRIERIEIRPFGPNRLHNVFITDLKGDSLIAAKEIRLRGVHIDADHHVLDLRLLQLHDARFRLDRAEGEEHTNLKLLLAKLASEDTSSGGAEWRIRVASVDIRRLHFSMNDHNVPVQPYGVDFKHVDANTADVIGTNLRMAGDSVLLNIDRISLRDRSGLVLHELSGDTKVSPRGIRITGMRLKTPGTDLRGDLRFTTKEFGDLDLFETNVGIRLDLDSSRVQFADIALFEPDLQGIDLSIGLKGRFRGTINELKARDMQLLFGDRSRFRGNVEMSGLPNVPGTFMVIDVKDLHADQNDLAGLPVPPFIERQHLMLPEEVRRMGTIDFAGNFTGFINSFTAYGHTRTDVGALNTDLTYERDTITHYFQLRGSLATDGFDLGRVLDDPTVGPIACDLRLEAVGTRVETMKATLEGSVPRLDVGRYHVGGIVLNGKLEKNLFNGRLHCDDPKVKLDFDGLADLRGRWPKVDFTADIEHLDARALGLIGGNGYSAIGMRVAAMGELAPDSLKGYIDMRDVTYCEDSLDLALGDVMVASDRMNGEPVLHLRSTMADADVTGPFFPTKLPEAVRSVLYSVFPALQSEVVYNQEEQRFAFDVNVKEAQPLLDVVAPGLELDSGTTFHGNFNSRTFDLDLSALLPHMRYGAFSGDSIEVLLDKTLDVLAFRFRSARQNMEGGTYINGIDLTGKAYQDEVQLRAAWEGSNSGASGDLNIDAQVLNGHSVSMDLRPSSLFFGRGAWKNDRTAHMLIDTSSIRIDSLELRNDGQYVLLNGTISEDKREPLAFDLRDVRLENLGPFLSKPALRGSVGGDGRVFSLYKNPYLLSYLCVDSLELDQHPIGDMRFGATWNNEENLIDLTGDLQRDTVRILGFAGKLAPGREQELDVDLSLDRFDLRFLEPYLPSGISDVQGRVTGKVDVLGKLAQPRVNGEVLLNDAGLRINYLNTLYTFTNPVSIREDAFFMDNVTLHDELGGTAHANSFTVYHKHLSEWNFDVNAELNGLMVLNTTLKDNSLYYGRAFGRGDLNVSGYTDNLEITVDARTERGTSLHFPLGASTEVGGLPFVRFVSPGQNQDSIQAPIDLSGVHLDMKVAVTPDAEFELIFDPTVGDIMSGRGRGDLHMTVTPSGDFSMRGGVEITQGDYLFTLRNLVNKKFTVDPGGRITWFGDPFDAQLNIDAVYKLRTALYDIMPPSERNEQYRKRVPVEVLMHLTEKLTNPDIGFEVRLPTVDEGTRTQVNTILSDRDRMNKQVFGLLVVNKFLPDASISGGAAADLGADALTSGATTLSEFASSQVSNALNKLTNAVDVGLNYRPGSAITSDEWEVALGTQLFNDRVQLSTNVGVATGNTSSTQRNNQLLGDFSAEYRITSDGKLRLKAFSQSNDRNLNQLNQAPTTQGVGIAFNREFNILGFWRRMMNKLRAPENKKPLE